MANGEDWYHQRHIVAPAFMGDKLKVRSFFGMNRLITTYLIVFQNEPFNLYIIGEIPPQLERRIKYLTV